MLDEKVKELDAAIEAKRSEAQQLGAKFEEKKAEVLKSDADVTDVESEAFKAVEAAMAEMGKAEDDLSALENRRTKLWSMTGQRGVSGDKAKQVEAIKDGMASRETPGARIVAGEAYKRLVESGQFTISNARIGDQQLGQMATRDEFIAALEGKPSAASLIVTDADGDSTVRPFIEPQQRGFIEPRYRELILMDLITVLPTTTDSIEYVVETGFTNNAAFVPEATTDEAIAGEITAALGGRKPQSTLTYEKKAAAVKTIAHWISATKKALADAPRLRGLVDKRLTRGLLDVIEDQIMLGDGLDENLEGILETTGVQHQDRGAGPLVDDILRGMTKVELAHFRVGATGLNPLDLEGIRLMRDESGGEGTGQYLFGPPSAAGATTLWGKPIVSGTQFNSGQPVVGDWSTVELYVREGIQVLASDSHADFFIRNLVAILAEMRLGLVLPQPEALCEISEVS